MADNREAVSELYYGTRNLLDLLERQGYDIADYKNMGINEVHIRMQNSQLDMTVNKKNGSKALVKFHTAKALRPANLTEYVESAYNLEKTLGKDDSLLVVTRNDPNETLIRMVVSLWDQHGIFVTVFNIDRLQFNILDHAYVPPHTVLTDEESAAVRSRYNIKGTDMPEISRFDPVAQAIGIRPGQMCKITRASRTAITAPFYRICIGRP